MVYLMVCDGGEGGTVHAWWVIFTFLPILTIGFGSLLIRSRQLQRG